jgi:hypothetical protein
VNFETSGPDPITTTTSSNLYDGHLEGLHTKMATTEAEDSLLGIPLELLIKIFESLEDLTSLYALTNTNSTIRAIIKREAPKLCNAQVRLCPFATTSTSFSGSGTKFSAPLCSFMFPSKPAS